MKDKKLFTEDESTMQKYLIKYAEPLHVKQLFVLNKVPLSDTTMAVRCTLLVKKLKEQLLVKLRMSACFCVQWMKLFMYLSIYEAQLLVYCKFPDASTSKMSKHVLFCDSFGIQNYYLNSKSF